MYNNGLYDEELCNLHKKIKLNLNLFLEDILNNDLFKVVDKGDYYNIYPLFYCDRIETDGNAFINGSYSITCKKDYEHIFLFISDSQIITSKTYTLANVEEDIWIIFVYDEWTFQPIRETLFSVDYGDGVVKQYVTDKLGYCIFTAENNDFEVVL